MEPSNQSALDPGELFVHESGHALAYDALGIPLKSCSVFTFADSKLDHGSTKSNADGPPPTFPSMCFILMAGPAAHMFVAGKPFDVVANRFYSDFSFLFRKFPQLFQTDPAAASMIVKLRRFAETFCKDWVLTNKQPVLRLAISVQSNLISPGHYELAGDMLNEAVLRAWQSSAVALEANIVRSLHPLLDASVEVSDDLFPWLNNWIGRMRQDTTPA